MTDPAIDRLVEAVRAIGVDFNPAALAATRALYAPLVPHADAGIPVRLDVPYGSHERQAIDIYGANAGPGLLFIHGGGFVAGNKRGDDLFYGNIGRAFAAAGVQAALTNYRLAPGATWPSGMDDIRAAIDTLVRETGLGTPARPLVLIGQSAGAAHAAGYLFDERHAGHAASHLAGCALLSGYYGTAHERHPGAFAYFGDESTHGERCPIQQVRAVPLPVLLTACELDPPRIAVQTWELAAKLTLANGRSPAVQWFAGHNHVSTVHSIGTPQRDVLDTLLAFVRRCADR